MSGAHDDEYAGYVSARFGRLHRTAHLMCGDAHRADDLVQATLLSLYVHWKRAATVENLDGYVHRIMVRRFLDEKRLSWSRVFLRAQLPEQPAGGTYGGARDNPEERDRMLRVLRALPRDQRAAVVLRYYADLSVEDTAQALGCSIGTVKSRCSRALAALRTALVAENLADAYMTAKEK